MQRKFKHTLKLQSPVPTWKNENFDDFGWRAFEPKFFKVASLSASKIGISHGSIAVFFWAVAMAVAVGSGSARFN